MRRTFKIIEVLLACTLLFSVLTGCIAVKNIQELETSDIRDQSDKPIQSESPAHTEEQIQSETPVPTEEPLQSASPIPTEEPPSEREILQEAAWNYLDAINCPLASEDDNRLGLSITSIEKADGEYKISWELGNTNAMGNEFMIFASMHFFDPEDFSNNYEAFTTLDDGQIQYTFGSGDAITYNTFRISFEPASKIVYLFFEGALESDGAPSEFYTQPLFFTLVLGEEPMILESTPRLANGIFDTYLPDTTGTN